MSRVVRDVRAESTPASPHDAANIYTDTEDHALIQARLALIYGIFAAILAGFYVLVVAYTAIAVPSRFWELLLSPAKIAHLVGILLLANACRGLRGRSQSRGKLAATDLAATVGIMVITAVVVALMPVGIHADMGGCVVYILVVTVRAALVPSPPRWTVLVSVLGAIPIPIGTYARALRDTSWDVDLVPRSSVLFVSTGWCAAAVVAAWTISRIVYGLRAEVKSATRLGQYTLEDKIGEGGMGTVYRARHALLQRPTAIKLLSPDHSGAIDVKRFEREVQLTSKLTHPNTIAIYDFGHTRTGVFYYAMELIDGVSLQDLVEEDGGQPAGRVVFILAQIAGALAEAHETGLIHRDVKPANILLALRGGLPDFVKVLDFGLVKETGSVDPLLSTANAIAGTPHYMAPESITKPESMDGRADLYALGGVAFFLLTGETVFEGTNLVEIMSHHLHTAARAPSRLVPATPGALDAIVLRCLAKKPGDRPASARVLAAALRDLQDEIPWDEEVARAWWTARLARTPVRTGSTSSKLANPGEKVTENRP